MSFALRFQITPLIKGFRELDQVIVAISRGREISVSQTEKLDQTTPAVLLIKRNYGQPIGSIAAISYDSDIISSRE
ncbi:hypothetical protein B6S09_00830 [Oceanimonas baumannii]|uniref:Uncharacterized protein n=1 Tax=Oceanimonas baumannii TaxID=129578 RepID=A0A235CP08_9GAMM|nr:hypothetical protein B6S09_00830 [Oceanimonas baumannii]